MGFASNLSFPGSAWERTAREALPRIPGRRFAPWIAPIGRQSLPGSAFPGRAWEREYQASHIPHDLLEVRRRAGQVDRSFAGRAVVMVTHDADAAAYGDRVVHIKDGLVASEETVGSGSRQ